MQQFLKPAARLARARVVTPEFLDEFFIPVHYAMAAFDPGFRRESLPTLTRCLETRIGRGVWVWSSWHTSSFANAPRVGPRIITTDWQHSLGLA
jgi:hypothetical protein